jgi:hypothetical protein
MDMHKVSSETQITCKHFWVCESALEPTSRAVCKHCGAVAEFKNWVSELEVMHGGLDVAYGRSSRGGQNAKNEWQRRMQGFSLVAAAYELGEIQ